MIITKMSLSQCAPDLRTIYDFDIGDVFQYKTEIKDWSTGDGEPETKVVFEKKTLMEKSISNDSLIFVFESIVYSYDEAPSNAPVDKYRESFSSYYDTLIVVDSASHYLNACDSQLVYISDFYTKVKISEQDGLAERRFGGVKNIFTYTSNDSLVESNDNEYEQIFVEGLGLTRLFESVFEYSKEIVLQGYIKNSDTTGIVWDYQDFTVSVEEFSSLYNVSVFPTLIPINGIIHISSDVTVDDVKVFSIDGKPLDFFIVNQSQIKINRVVPNTYILIVTNGNNIR